MTARLGWSSLLVRDLGARLKWGTPGSEAAQFLGIIFVSQKPGGLGILPEAPRGSLSQSMSSTGSHMHDVTKKNHLGVGG